MTTGDLFADDDAPGTDADALRQRWRQLVETELPAVAPDRQWPIHLDHCFARVLLDNACDRPWREVIKPPAWRNAPTETLTNAIALGEACLAGDAAMAALNARSLEMRGKGSFF